MKYYVKEVVGGVPTRQFKVYVPEFDEHGHYQQKKSMNAFYDHWNTIYQKIKHQPGNLSSHYFLINRSTDTTLGYDFPLFDNNLSTVTCMSVWDFYELICWNHKRKKINA